MELHPILPAERNVLRTLYRRAFPPDELLSWSTLERLAREGKAELLTVWDNGPAGILVTFPTPELVLGVFLAILPERRCGGIGTTVLETVRSRYAPRPVCLEIEAPEELGAPNPEQRRRRKGFYLRNGCKCIAKMHIYGADMELLATDDTVTFEAYRGILRRVFGGHYTDTHLIPR